MKSSRKGLSVLTLLRIDGPIGRAGIAKSLGWELDEVDDALWDGLYAQGLAELDTTSLLWDLTDLGRGLFTAHLSARRRDRECTGVTAHG